MFAAIAAAMKIGGIAERESKMRTLGQYRSRGKGRGTPARNFGHRGTDWTGRRSGFREAARRERQLDRGLLTEHPRAVVMIQHRKAA